MVCVWVLRGTHQSFKTIWGPLGWNFGAICDTPFLNTLRSAEMYVDSGVHVVFCGRGKVPTYGPTGSRVTHLCSRQKRFGAQKRRTPVAMYMGAPKKQRGEGGGSNRVVQSMMREPLSFWGGVFAGFLALDLQQDPLKGWIAERAGEAGLDYLAAKERLAARQAGKAGKD